MNNIFNFKISNDLRKYKDNQVYIEVSLVGHNLSYFIKEIEKFKILIKKHEPIFYKTIDSLNKSKFHKNQELMKKDYVSLNEYLKKIHFIMNSIFPENKKNIKDKYEHLINNINSLKDCYYDGVTKLIEDFYNELIQSIENKKHMCIKLKLIENKILKAIITFDELNYDIHFTKYHLNLEEFSYQLHDVLKDELNEKYMNKYKQLEDYHFQLMRSNTLSSSVKSILVFIADITKNYEDIMSIPEKIVKSQFKHKLIESDVNYLMNLYIKMEHKFNEVYKYVEFNQEVDKNLYLKIISIIYESKIDDLININKYVVNSLIKYVNLNKHYNNINYLSLGNLMKIEPELSNKLIYNTVKKMYEDKEFTTISLNDKFMMKKNKKQLFEMNHSYSHEIIVYDILPNEIDLKKNKYIHNSGYDKILVNEKIQRVVGDVFCHTINRTIRYEFYIKMATYYINYY